MGEWERSCHDLQIYYVQQEWSWGTQLFKEWRGDICNRTWGDRTFGATMILILIFAPSLGWLRIMSHYCNYAWRLLWCDHGCSPHWRRTAQNYGKGGAGFYDSRRLGCMTAPELRIEWGGELQWSAGSVLGRGEIKLGIEGRRVEEDQFGGRQKLEVFGKCWRAQKIAGCWFSSAALVISGWLAPESGESQVDCIWAVVSRLMNVL